MRAADAAVRARRRGGVLWRSGKCRRPFGCSRPSRQIALAVEVASRWNADDDRELGKKRERRSKWNGYALVGVAHYLLIDRDPRRMTATLYTVPDPDGGVYRESRAWRFGEEFVLPESHAVTVPTGEWDAWDED